MNSLQYEPEMCMTQLCCALLWQHCMQTLIDATPQTQVSDIPVDVSLFLSNESNADATTEKHKKWP